MRTYVRMRQDQLDQITARLAEQLYVNRGRGTPVTVPWNSPHIPGPVRRSHEQNAGEAVHALHDLGLLREP